MVWGVVIPVAAASAPCSQLTEATPLKLESSGRKDRIKKGLF